ncbi:MAG: M28 family peptidase, partial [Gemmatimonadetes bacterium]|nr:M28 family peptidase [Gemmatimonadota bacterium]
GYRVDELSFSFSAWPGRFGLPAVGLLYLAGIMAATVLLLGGRGAAALVPLGALVPALLLAAILGRYFIARLPWGRIRTANWLIYRPGSRPRYLVMAHRDSKAQPVSLWVRAAVTLAAALAAAALFLSALLTVIDPAWGRSPVTLGAAGMGALAALGMLLSWAGNSSPGALDNASGLAALLGLARRERAHGDTGFLITDGEELGLAGARALAGRLPPVFGVLNLDGLDDAGDFAIIERYGWPRRGLAPHLSAALLEAAASLGLPAARRPLPVGILVDHIPLMDAGTAAVTIMRGSARSLRRVHRPADRAERMSGAGAAAAVALVAAALQLLREQRSVA